MPRGRKKSQAAAYNDDETAENDRSTSPPPPEVHNTQKRKRKTSTAACSTAAFSEDSPTKNTRTKTSNVSLEKGVTESKTSLIKVYMFAEKRKEFASSDATDEDILEDGSDAPVQSSSAANTPAQRPKAARTLVSSLIEKLSSLKILHEWEPGQGSQHQPVLSSHDERYESTGVNTDSYKDGGRGSAEGLGRPGQIASAEGATAADFCSAHQMPSSVSNCRVRQPAPASYVSQPAATAGLPVGHQHRHLCPVSTHHTTVEQLPPPPTTQRPPSVYAIIIDITIDQLPHPAGNEHCINPQRRLQR